MAQPLAGGPPRRLLACVTGGAVAVGRAGVYYVPCWGERPPDTDAMVRLLDPATGRIEPPAIRRKPLGARR
jgi:hypothetical protein